MTGTLAAWLAIWLLWLGWSLLRVPIPGIDEPHYLGKARHFWNPDWCPGDFFLDSSNPHLVFYATFGWPTRFLSLPQTALLGRCAGLAILAAGWLSLCRPLLGSRSRAIVAAVCFLFLQSLGNWSGEWAIGGIESRVVAWGLLFGGLGQFLSQRPVIGGALLGLAVSFHPLIGSWGVIALLLSLVLERLCTSTAGDLHSAAAHTSSSPTVSGIAAVVCGLVCALPGLIPALDALHSPSREAALIADQLQVGDRLKHHLDPMTFPVANSRYLGLQLTLACLLAAGLEWTAARRRWKWLLAAALLVAAVGVLLGWGPRPIHTMPGWEWRIRLLKFYPFRLADLLVPVTLSLLAAWKWSAAWTGSPQSRLELIGFLAAAVTIAFIVPFNDSRPSRLPDDQQSALLEAYDWLRQNSQSDDLCQALDVDWGLRWHADRAEFVSYKDMPQDAASLVEWNNRLWTMSHWKQSADDDRRFTRQELAELRGQTGIRFVVARTLSPARLLPRTFESTPEFANKHFAVLECPATTP